MVMPAHLLNAAKVQQRQCVRSHLDLHPAVGKAVHTTKVTRSVDIYELEELYFIMFIPLSFTGIHLWKCIRKPTKANMAYLSVCGVSNAVSRA